MKTVTVFTVADVEKIIIDSMSIHKYTKIEPIVSKVAEGYGMNERDVVKFQGYRVTH
jgi:hypothetical protein